MKMSEMTEKVLHALRGVSGLKSVELYAGQLDDYERYRSRMPGILLLFRENPFDDSYDYENTDIMRYSAILMYSNKRSTEEQVLESLDKTEEIIEQLQKLRGMRIESLNPVEFNKAFCSFEVQFYMIGDRK